MELLLCTDIETYTEAHVAQLLQGMPPSQQQRLQQEKLFSRRREKAIAYQLLREYLLREGMDHGAPQIGYAPQGRPLLINYPALHISISHCKSAVAVAVHDSPIGIDAESIRKHSPSLVERSFSAAEQEQIAQAPNQDSEFTRLWTRKEAYLKYLGTGIQGMDSLQQVPPTDAIIETQPLPNHSGWISICHK